MSQNRIELLCNLYRAGQELRRAMEEWRVGQPVRRLGLPAGHSEEVVEAIVKVEQAVEAIAKTGMFEPVSDAVAAQRMKDALAEPDAACRVYQDALLTIAKGEQLLDEHTERPEDVWASAAECAKAALQRGERVRMGDSAEPDEIEQLCDLLREAGLTPRLHGTPIDISSGSSELRSSVARSLGERLKGLWLQDALAEPDAACRVYQDALLTIAKGEQLLDEHTERPEDAWASAAECAKAALQRGERVRTEGRR
jgi:hypothetical protein